jgi:2-hydroxychromene-2-carboxylate isomerase
MARTLEFFFDYGSPYSYLASTQIAGLRDRTGCELRYRPMLLGGVFKATGNRSPALEPVEPKRRHFGVDLLRWVEHYGVPFQRNPHFPINTLQIMRAAHAAESAGAFDRFHAVVFPAFWAQGKNLGDPEEFAAVLEGGGLDPDSIMKGAQDQAIKTSLRETTDEAVDRGVFGAPTFFLGDEMFFGNDRLLFVENALKG